MTIENISQIVQTHLIENKTDTKQDYKSMPASIVVETMQHKITYLKQERELIKNHFTNRQKAEQLIMNDSNLKYQIIHSIVSAKDNVLNIKELCEVAGVSESGYFA